MIRHNVLHCFFWTKAVLAMAMALFCLFWFCWRIYDLHTRATPAFFDGLQPIVITNPDGTTSKDCAYNSASPYGRLEPQVAGQSIGFSLDWSYDTPKRVVDLLNGFRPTVYNAYMDFGPLLVNYYDQSMLNWYGSEAGRVGAMLELTVQIAGPNAVRVLTDEHFDALSKGVAAVNSAYGVPVLLRFGHEMNGPWSTYGFDPTGYIPCFQAMTNSLRRHTNMTAMVWAPNVGFGYPFGTSGGITLPSNGSANFLAMDTNRDGVITSQDDPYGPYWPGAEYVDWVGISLYYYPPDEFKNHAMPEGYFDAYLTGTGYNQDGTDAWKTNYNFYKRYASPDGFNKAMMLPETGSPYLYTNLPGDTPGPSASLAGDALAQTASQLHEEWYSSILKNTTVLQKYPKLKIIVQFEEQKLLANFWRDWRVLNNTESRTSFVNGLKTWGSDLKQSSAFVYSCNGDVKLA
ncbi:UNVERIFIED_CONTAM: hypothetical protein HDU68_007426 [Siphonaria sp. JEL0065]|nr:hypothetical protein HDU68_007426 [Siphonaria sp. JEL0065]